MDREEFKKMLEKYFEIRLTDTLIRIRRSKQVFTCEINSEMFMNLKEFDLVKNIKFSVLIKFWYLGVERAVAYKSDKEPSNEKEIEDIVNRLCFQIKDFDAKQRLKRDFYK